MLEHIPAFLVLLWLNALFVGPRYLVSRAVYPLLLGQRFGQGRTGSDPLRDGHRLRGDRRV